MDFKERTKQDLKRCIEKLENQSFDEIDISTLMISLRPYFKKLDIIWEIACFVAHVEDRAMGICHTSIDRKYAKLKHCSMYSQPPINLNVDKIEKDIFEVLIIGSIEEYSEKLLLEKLNISRYKAKKLVVESYDKQGKFYVLKHQHKTNKRTGKIQTIASLVTSQIVFEPAIKNESLLKQMVIAIEEIIPNLDIDEIDVPELINKNKDDIILCVMCLLHSATFRLFDGTVSNSFLSGLSTVNSETETLEYILNLNCELNISNSKVIFPILTLDGDATKYFPTMNFTEPQSINGLAEFNAIRNTKSDLIVGKR